ncbi:MAG TPA: hypothetical protein VF435_09240 [Pyrinomonadaceae bacterium]
MATSPAHRFGQIIGEVLESAITPLLEDFAKTHGLYLDKHGERPCRTGKKCTWVDLNKNAHDLDFVLERGGTANKKGMPAAFIEVAWRRYTKHSRNKAQEIQGAVMPLIETYRNLAPFQGAILAGVFTKGALTQLRSLGFIVLYFSYETVIEVFRKFSIDAAFDEQTPDAEFEQKVKAYEDLSPEKRKALAGELIKACPDDVKAFMGSLTTAVSRQIESILVLPLHGNPHRVTTVEDALKFIQRYDENRDVDRFERYEIRVRYNNDNEVNGAFNDKESAIEFLRIFQPLHIVPVR